MSVPVIITQTARLVKGNARIYCSGHPTDAAFIPETHPIPSFAVCGMDMSSRICYDKPEKEEK